MTGEGLPEQGRLTSLFALEAHEQPQRAQVAWHFLPGSTEVSTPEVWADLEQVCVSSSVTHPNAAPFNTRHNVCFLPRHISQCADSFMST